MMCHRTIRARMMAWILGVTGLILAGVMLWSYTTSRERIKSEMREKARFLADGAARRIDAKLGVLQGIVGGMALSLEAQNLDIPFDQARAMQTQCLRENPGIYGCCIALEPDMAPDGWPDLAAYEHRKGGKVEYIDLSGPDHVHTREDWYTLPKYLGQPVWSEPYQWDGVLMVTYSVPIRVLSPEGRRFAGVITCDLTIDWIEKLLEDLPLGEDGYGLLMSRNGTYVSHPLQELVLNETIFSIAEARNDPALRAIGHRMVSGDPDIMPFVSFATGELSWLAFTPLRSADWIMGALISWDEMNKAVLQLSHRQGIVGIVGLLLLALAVGLIARSIARPISRLRDAAGVLAGGNLDADLPTPRGCDEISHLTGAFSDMRDNLKRYIADLRETTAARERILGELRVAHDIQMGLVPRDFSPFPGRTDLDLFAVLEPAREIGGDLYDFFPLDNDRLVVAVGDVSGKGVPAALFMAVTRSFIRSVFRSESDPARAMEFVNNALAEGNESCMFVTLFCAVLRLSDGTLQFSNAGHNPPLLRHPDGRQEWITDPHGSMAGAMPSSTYTTGTITLQPETNLILYTDGVTEAMNAAGDMYGEERLAGLIHDAVGGCRKMTEFLIADIKRFAAGTEPSDDITIVMLRRKGS